MARSSWNAHVPDVVGVEFVGVGFANHIISSSATMRAFRFHAQRSGEVDQLALYSGAQTSNPPLTAAHWFGHRAPFIAELIPITGFDPGTGVTQDQFGGDMTSNSNVVDYPDLSPVEGDELSNCGDGNRIIQSANFANVVVHIPGASTFPLTRQVLNPVVVHNQQKQARISRIDQTLGEAWSKLLPGGFTDFHDMGEVRIEANDTADWQFWTPTNIRQFASSVGNRRLRTQGIQSNQGIFDCLRLHVNWIPERRAGCGVFEPPATWQWVTFPFHAPAATGTPATVTAGVDYALVVRMPRGNSDYGNGAPRFDLRTLADRRAGASFVHFSDLDWDTHACVTIDDNVPGALGELQDGLVAARIINNGQQTVDSQPYSGSSSGVLPTKADGFVLTNFPTTFIHRPRQQLDVPVGTTQYGKARVNVALLKTALNAPVDKKSVIFELVDNAESIIAGPFHITEAIWDASPVVGTAAGIFEDEYRQVTIDLASAIDPNEALGVRARFTLHPDYIGNIIWRIGTVMADIVSGHGGDQTAAGSATGHAFIAPSNTFQAVHNNPALVADLQVLLVEAPPPITGTNVIELAQLVTGGPCDPCSAAAATCRVESIPYARVCWAGTTLKQHQFGYYEVQRLETQVSEEWATVAVIAPTGIPISGAPVTGVATCWDDWSHVYDTQVCYRVRQLRADTDTLSNFVETACVTIASPDGGEIVITAPDNPDLNVAFSEAAGSRLPIEREWDNLDADQVTLRTIYGRNGFLAFRPLERLGWRFQRQVLISSLCTPTPPCLSVADQLIDICSAHVSALVVRDRCGNRFFASVSVPTVTEITDPTLGKMWLATIQVTELATPLIEP